MRKMACKWIFATFVAGAVMLIGFSVYAVPRAAVLSMVSGSVEIQKADIETWKAATANMELSVKDKVRTGNGSRCELTLDDGSLIKLRENSTMEIKELDQNEETKEKASVFKLIFGKLFAKAEHQDGSKFEINTPSAIAGIRGTEFAVICGIDGVTDILVFKGKIELKTIGEEVGKIKVALILEGQAMGTQIKGGIGVSRDISPKEMQEWQNFIKSGGGTGQILVLLTPEEKAKLKEEIGSIKGDIIENRLFGLKVKKTDFAAGRTMKDHAKRIVRVEQRLYRPTSNSLRFLNLNMRGTPSADNLQYYENYMQFTGNIPDSVIQAGMAIATGAVDLVLMRSTWANAAPSVVARDVFEQGYDAVTEEGYITINGTVVEFDGSPEVVTEPTESSFSSRVKINLAGGAGNECIYLDNWIINNNGDVLGLNSFLTQDLYSTLRNDIGFEVAWDLSDCGFGITMNKGGVIDVVFIPDMIFLIVDSAIAELPGLLTSAEIPNTNLW